MGKNNDMVFEKKYLFGFSPQQNCFCRFYWTNDPLRGRFLGTNRDFSEFCLSKIRHGMAYIILGTHQNYVQLRYLLMHYDNWLEVHKWSFSGLNTGLRSNITCYSRNLISFRSEMRTWVTHCGVVFPILILNPRLECCLDLSLLFGSITVWNILKKGRALSGSVGRPQLFGGWKVNCDWPSRWPLSTGVRFSPQSFYHYRNLCRVKLGP